MNLIEFPVVSRIAAAARKLSRQWVRLPWNLWANGVVQWPVVPVNGRWLLLKIAGADVQPCAIGHGVFIGTGSTLHVGRGAFINTGTFIDDLDEVRIGRNVHLAMNVTIATSTHVVGPSTQRAGESRFAPVVIGDGVWVMAGATILPGVTVGKGAMILAGAVVNRDCEPDTIYGGVPAKALGPVAAEAELL